MAEPTDPDGVRRATTGTAKGEVTHQAPSRTQTLVARRVAESRATVPDITLDVTADMEAALALEPALSSPGAAPHALDGLVIRACALALRAVPQANGAWRDGRLERYARVNVGFTVSVDATLVVPTIFDADSKDPTSIAGELAALTRRVLDGEVTQPELSGATFTVSDLGQHGARRVTPIIIPPQAGILGVGALTARAAVRDGALQARHQLDLTLSADHRVLYGAQAAAFLAAVRSHLEDPASLVL